MRTAPWIVGFSCAAACSSANPDAPPTLAVTVGCSYASDAGVQACDDAHTAVPYVPGGPFTVDVTATPNDPADIAPATALRAQIQIVSPLVPAGATSSTSVALLPSDAGSYAGGGALAWPPGGPVDVRVQVGGIVADRQLELDRPSLDIKPATGTQNGTQATVPVCVQSAAISGSVAIHLDGATLFNGTATDQTMVLEIGACDTASTMWHSHVSFTATTMATSFSIVASLLGPTASVPPVVTTPPFVVTPPLIQPVNPVTGITFDLPVSLVHPVGEAVTVEAVVTAANGTPRTTVSFTSSPAIALIPMSSATDPATGKASTTFSMPDLMGTALVIGATAGTVTRTMTLSNR